MREVTCDEFEPNGEYNPPRFDEHREYRSVEEVDFKALSEKEAVFITGDHPGADYAVKPRDTESGRRVDVWRDRDANGFSVPLEAVTSYTYSAESVYVGGRVYDEMGVIKKGHGFAMPFFSYEEVEGRKSVKKLDCYDVWSDKVAGIRIQEIE